MKPQNEHQDSIRRRAAQESLESAAHDTGRGAEATPGHDASHAERRQRVAVEQRRLQEWAEKNGKLKGNLLSQDARGGEHFVYYHERRGCYFKATRPEAQMGYGIAYGVHYHSGEGLLVHHLLPKNVKVSEQDGIIQPIDPVIQRVTPEFAEFLRRHPIARNAGTDEKPV